MSKCTPDYNDETRRLMAHAADLRRVAKGAESGDFGEAIRAKANEVIDKGETDPDKVVEAVHKYINEYAPHEKSDVAAAIVENKPRTRSEAAARRAEVARRATLSRQNKAALTRHQNQEKRTDTAVGDEISRADEAYPTKSRIPTCKRRGSKAGNCRPRSRRRSRRAND
jgi:hypothetical protein